MYVHVHVCSGNPPLQELPAVVALKNNTCPCPLYKFDFEDDPRLRTPEKVTRSRNESSVKLSHKKQKFRNKWLQNTEFKNWLVPAQNDTYKGKCKLCNTEITAEITVIKKHMTSKKHQVIIRSS
ncbi:BESS domain-containing protein [Aphis craccivora]|uniref:BESS domain-containing protein n=1 Tax=Aphis craccivora TaxID=307492 RepID=A0A6G0Y753_APHCR|nr:BESS domain-containing protein [Aphis craccivora]